VHQIEPYYAWEGLYQASEDPRSPLFGAENDLNAYSTTIYGYYIHPQWDSLDSRTLYLKILFADYETDQVAIIEFLGEWNDAIENDVMDPLIQEGIKRFILIGENVFNFHGSDDEYYAEWFEDVDDDGGWIAALGFQEHVYREMANYHIDTYLHFGGQFDTLAWRTFSPLQLAGVVEGLIQRRLGA
jgi:hypothetical protein